MIGNDIENLIQAHKNKMELLNIEEGYLLRTLLGGPTGYKPIDYSGMPHGSKSIYTSDKDWDKLQGIQKQIENEQWAINNYENQLKKIKDTMIGLKGVDAQVKYLRDIGGLSLQEIADKTKYELGYIKKVSARNSRNCKYSMLL